MPTAADAAIRTISAAVSASPGSVTFREIDGEGHAVVGGDIVRGIAQYKFVRFRGPFNGLPFPFAVAPGIGGRRNGLKGQADGGGKLLDGRLVPGAEHVELKAVALHADRDGEIVRKGICAHVAVRDAVALGTEIDDQESAFVFGIGHVAAHVGVSFAAVEGQAAINAVYTSYLLVDGDAFLHAEGASAHVVKVDGILCKGVSGGGAHRAEGQEDRRGEQQRQQEGEGDAPRLHRFYSWLFSLKIGLLRSAALPLRSHNNRTFSDASCPR